MKVSDIRFSTKKSHYTPEQAKQVYYAVNAYPDIFPSTGAYVLFQYLLHRIYRYHKHADWVYSNHLDEGVFDAKGHMIQSPCLLKRTARQTAFTLLEKAGIVSRAYTKAGALFVELHPEKVIERMASRLKVSKKRTNCTESNQNQRIYPVPECGMGVPECGTISKDNISKGRSRSKPKVMSAGGRQQSPEGDSIEKTQTPLPELENALAKIREVSATKTQKALSRAESQTIPSKKVFQAMWREAIKTHERLSYQETLTAKDWGSFTQSAKSLPRDTKVSQVVGWAVAHWGRIIYPKFFWTHQPKYQTISVTKTPSLPFFCRYFSRIIKLYAEYSSDVATLTVNTYKDFQPTSDNVNEQLAQALAERDYFKAAAAREALDEKRAAIEALEKAKKQRYLENHAKRMKTRTPEDLASWGPRISADDSTLWGSFEDRYKKNKYSNLAK